eukprot:359964-Chlamydomonas_euryale.AAC.1
MPKRASKHGPQFTPSDAPLVDPLASPSSSPRSGSVPTRCQTPSFAAASTLGSAAAEEDSSAELRRSCPNASGSVHCRPRTRADSDDKLAGPQKYTGTSDIGGSDALSSLRSKRTGGPEAGAWLDAASAQAAP